MRKEHKHRHNHDLVPVGLGSVKEEASSEKDCIREKKKFKRHKNHDSGDYSSGLRESSPTLSDKVIQIHGSSSEDENNSGIEERRVLCRNDQIERKHSSRHRDHKREEKRCLKKHRSVDHCERHHLSKRQEREKKRISDSDTEENHSNRHKRHKGRVSSPENGGDVRREDRKVKDKYKERNSEHGRKKIKRESLEGSEELFDKQIKKLIKDEPKQERDHKSNSSGSKNSCKSEPRSREIHEWGGGSENKEKRSKQSVEAQKPNFSLSGKLAEDTNMYNGVVIKYSEPPEARMPKKRWRLYPFKGDQGLPTLYIHRQSAYLLGRDRKVVDIPIDHPSCSKQHAALQYRLVTYQRPNGTTGKQIRLYIIDLESANGTFINNNKIDSKKYVELFEKDVIKFGFSSREYVLLHEHSKDDNSEDEF